MDSSPLATLHPRHRLIWPVAALILIVIALYGTGVAPTRAAGNTPTPTPVPSTSRPDRTRLPIGDGKVTTTPKIGYVFSCQTSFGNGGGAFKDGPWIKSDGTFDLTTKAVVDGAVKWAGHKLSIKLSGKLRLVTSNDLPDHITGIYPIQKQDDAYQFDHNPNTIGSQQIAYSLPASPVLAATPSCLPGGAVGILTTGVVFFDALDAEGRDAVAHETLDGCEGHPERSGMYHYHMLTDCLADPGTGHSSLVGYALDGFGIFGLRGEDGKPLTSADLDECHGHTHEIMWDGKLVTMYHYHMTADYPYTLDCYRGTPIRTRPAGGPPPTGQSGQNSQPGQAGPPNGGQGGPGNPPPPGGGPGNPPPPPPQR